MPNVAITVMIAEFFNASKNLLEVVKTPFYRQCQKKIPGIGRLFERCEDSQIKREYNDDGCQNQYKIDPEFAEEASHFAFCTCRHYNSTSFERI